MSAQHHSPGIRAHLRKYGISHDDRERLRRALVTLDALGEPIKAALSERGGSASSYAEVRDVIRTMVNAS